MIRGYPMLKFTIVFLIIATPVVTPVAAQKGQSQDELNSRMCGGANFQFDSRLNRCSYCAHGLEYDANQKCRGIPDVIGKCFGDHHYHAATQECHFCAFGHAFNETSRQCEFEGSNAS